VQRGAVAVSEKVITMSLTVSRAVSHIREQLPDHAEITSVGATLYARNITEEEAHRIDGDKIDDRMICLVRYFSGEGKFVYNLESGRQTLTA